MTIELPPALKKKMDEDGAEYPACDYSGGDNCESTYAYRSGFTACWNELAPTLFKIRDCCKELKEEGLAKKTELAFLQILNEALGE